MKKISTGFLGALAGAFFVILSPALSSAATAPADCAATVRGNINLTVRFATLSDVPHFTAKGAGDLCYEIAGKTASIKSESIPRLVYESDSPPAGLSHLTVFVDAMPGTKPVVNWESFPEVKLTSVDMRVRAYEAAQKDVSSDSKPIVDIVLSNLAFTTNAISVEKVDSVGYIDGDELEAMLVGRAILPDADQEAYKKALAGKEVLLELVVKMDNPYQKNGEPEDKCRGSECNGKTDRHPEKESPKGSDNPQKENPRGTANTPRGDNPPSGGSARGSAPQVSVIPHIEHGVAVK